MPKTSKLEQFAKKATLWLAENVAGQDAMKARIKKSYVPGNQGVSGFQLPVMPGFEEVNRQAIKRDRFTTVREIEEMIAVDSRVDKILDKLGSDACLNFFTVNVKDAGTEKINKRAQTIINRTLKNVQAKDKLRGWTKALLRDGDLFWQVIVDPDANEIIRAKKLDSTITFSRMNSEGTFPDDKKPYYQESPDGFSYITKEFEEWEIVHMMWDYEDGQPYGRPMLGSSRLAWRRLDEGEKNVVIRRKVRAGNRYMWTMGTEENPADWKEIKKYKKEIADTLESPSTVNQDFFSNGQIKMEIIKGDSTVDQIGDLSYFEGMLSMRAGIPTALISGGREAETNFAVIREQEEDYLRNLNQINQVSERGFVQLFEFALLLKSLNPDAYDFEFVWGAKDREDLSLKLERAVLMKDAGYSFETIMKQINLEGVIFEEELERIRAQVEEGLIPYGKENLDASTAQGKDILPNSTSNMGNGKPSGGETENLSVSQIKRIVEQAMLEQFQIIKEQTEYV